MAPDGLTSRYNSRVIEQVPDKVLFHYIAATWAAVGPLGGVIVGAYLSRSWDRQKWMNDNRKLEFRELIEALTDAATALMYEQRMRSISPHGVFEDPDARTKHLQALKVIKTRIFISTDMKEMNVFDRWSESIKLMIATDGVHHFETTYENLRDESIERATSVPRTFLSDFPQFMTAMFRR
jgi:hypothetical protein